MTIKKLRKTFKKALVYYQTAIDEQWDYETLNIKNMENGLCHFCKISLGVRIYNVFDTHYKKFLTRGYYLNPRPYELNDGDNVLTECIQPRLDFLKNEIKRLKKLENKGYTHV